MSISMITVIVGVLLIPLIVIQLAKRIRRLRTGEKTESCRQIKLNTIFKVSLLLCFLFILFGVLYGNIDATLKGPFQRP